MCQSLLFPVIIIIHYAMTWTHWMTNNFLSERTLRMSWLSLEAFDATNWRQQTIVYRSRSTDKVAAKQSLQLMIRTSHQILKISAIDLGLLLVSVICWHCSTPPAQISPHNNYQRVKILHNSHRAFSDDCISNRRLTPLVVHCWSFHLLHLIVFTLAKCDALLNVSCVAKSCQRD